MAESVSSAVTTANALSTTSNASAQDVRRGNGSAIVIGTRPPHESLASEIILEAELPEPPILHLRRLQPRRRRHGTRRGVGAANKGRRAPVHHVVHVHVELKSPSRDAEQFADAQIELP